MQLLGHMQLERDGLDFDGATPANAKRLSMDNVSPAIASTSSTNVSNRRPASEAETRKRWLSPR
ncbi:MAG TPA: hypothetical protein VG410_14465 [Solirubrobacteraceae bacterium]|nr:hypothetical protein [Solirubrobacteraceae bacterium]